MTGPEYTQLSAVPDLPATVLQTVSGVGGMIMAGILVLVLGLIAVAVWQGRISSLIENAFGSAQSENDDGSATVDRGIDTDGTAIDDGVGVRSEPPTTPEPESAEVTDRQRIVGILEENEGRMKQARIVDATGWSKSKVSMLLSEMEDDGEITKLRVGRENIISLSGEEPDAAGSPFDTQ